MLLLFFAINHFVEVNINQENTSTKDSLIAFSNKIFVKVDSTHIYLHTLWPKNFAGLMKIWYVDAYHNRYMQQAYSAKYMYVDL